MISLLPLVIALQLSPNQAELKAKFERQLQEIVVRFLVMQRDRGAAVTREGGLERSAAAARQQVLAHDAQRRGPGVETASRRQQVGSTEARELLTSRARDRAEGTAECAWYSSAWSA